LSRTELTIFANTTVITAPIVSYAVKHEVHLFYEQLITFFHLSISLLTAYPPLGERRIGFFYYAVLDKLLNKLGIESDDKF